MHKVNDTFQYADKPGERIYNNAVLLAESVYREGNEPHDTRKSIVLCLVENDPLRPFVVWDRWVTYIDWKDELVEDVMWGQGWGDLSHAMTDLAARFDHMFSNFA